MSLFLTMSGQRQLAYTLSGAAERPLVVMVHPLGMNQQVWQDMQQALVADHQVVSLDLPGHGRSSPYPAGQALSIEQLGADVVALIKHLGRPSCHYVGTSIGGAIGMSLLLNHPELIETATLTNTATKIGTTEAWLARAAAVRAQGLGALAETFVPRWFAPAFVQQQPAVIADWVAQLQNVDDESYAQLCEALATFDASEACAGLTQRVDLIAGSDDVAMPAATMVANAQLFQQVRLTQLAVGHVPSVEDAAAFLAVLEPILNGQ
ncbi:MAG: alpha/beta fold hydrolase [Neisseriaceae bacterium]|nr:alpha/beta fold hydrolase [Neisseriaceae bacterium]